MRILFFILALCYSSLSMAQKYYIKTFDPFNLEHEVIRDMTLQGNDIVFRANRDAKGEADITTTMGRYSITKDSMLNVEKLENVMSGFSLLEFGNDYLLASYGDENLKNISLSLVGSDFKLKKTIDFSLKPKSRYFNYAIREAIKFGDKSVLTAVVADTLNQYKWNGQMQCRDYLAIFVVNNQLNLDTSFVITPNSNSYWMRMNGVGVSGDSILYVSIYDCGPGFERRAIYGYNKQLKKVFSWIGPDVDSPGAARSSLIIDKDNTVYTAYRPYDYRTYLYAIDSKGKKKWECPFDSAMIKGPWNSFNLMIAKDGNILGSALRSSAMNDLGECAYIFKISTEGKMLWQKILRINKGFNTYPGGPNFGLAVLPLKIIELPNNDIIIGGRYSNFLGKNSSSGSSNDDLFIARLDSTGCLWKNCPYIQDVVQKPKYLPIVTARNEWVSYNVNPFPGDPNPINTLTFTSDSFLLNNKYYFKPKFKNSLNNIWKTGSAYYREKDGIVYLKKDATATEKILYNFNLGIGDTLPAVGDPKGIRIVEKVSTVIYADGIPRKMMTYAKPCQRVVVEGIGDIGAPFYSQLDCTLTNEYYEVTRCFSTDGKLIYKALGIQGCYTVAVKDVDVRLRNIYPNPTTGLLNIDTEDTQAIKSVKIVDNLGRIIQTDAFMATDNGIQLNISNLQNGLYFGKVVFSDGSKTGFKIIKVSE